MSRATPHALFLVLLAGTLALAPPAALAQETPDPVLVTGTVRDDAGNALQDVQVTINTYTPEGRESFDETFTDANGSYTLKVMPGKATINAWSKALNRGDSQGVLVEGNDTRVDLVIPLPPPKDAIITGVVFGTDGKPLEGATVTLGTNWAYAYASDGGATEPAPAPETAPAPESSATTTADASGEAPSEGADGQAARTSMPIRCCYDPGQGDSQRAVTDADGRYSFKTYEGNYRVSAALKGHTQTTIDVKAVSGKTVDADIRLEKIPDADAIVRGTVVDAETGLPLANAYVWMNNLEWGAWNQTTTGADGTFSFATIPGWIQLNVQINRDCCIPILHDEGATTDLKIETPPREYHTYLKAFAVKSGTNDQKVPLTPKPSPSIVLTGYVVDPDTQKGVPGAWVNFWNAETSDYGRAQTDATGSYKILVRPGHHQVNAWKEGYLGGADTVNVKDGAVTQRFDLFMPAGTTKNSGCWECDYRTLEASPESPTMMADAKSAPASNGTRTSAPQAAGAESGGDPGAMTYQGGGGGLPEYSPQDDTVSAAKKTPVPAIGLLAAVGALGLVAALLRRR